jgi:hypothetical protein
MALNWGAKNQGRYWDRRVDVMMRERKVDPPMARLLTKVRRQKHSQ